MVVDDRCTSHDHSDGDTIITFGTLYHGLFRLVVFMRHDVCIVSATCAMSDVELWHACFGHLKTNPMRLSKIRKHLNKISQESSKIVPRNSNSIHIFPKIKHAHDQNQEL